MTTLAIDKPLHSATWKRKFKSKGLDYDFWVRTPSDIQALEDGCWPFPELGQHVNQFFIDNLRHSIGRWAGKPFVPQQWQADIHMLAFSWLNKKDKRRIRRVADFEPKKNGKSTRCAGLAAYFMEGDGEAGAQVYGAAVDKPQARIIFNELCAMVEQSPTLAARLSINRSTSHITNVATRCFFHAMSADAKSKEGINASHMVKDELHAWANRDLWDRLEYSGRSREQPMDYIISTAGDDLESIGGQIYQKAKRVLAGEEIDTAFLPVIYECPMTEDWTDPAWWRKANPSMDVTMDFDDFAATFREANNRPSQIPSWRRYSLNQWIEQVTVDIDMDKWRACGQPFDLESLRGRKCYGAVDLATRMDTAAFVLYFPETHQVLAWFWVPERSLEDRAIYERDTMRGFARSGHLALAIGETTDYDAIRAKIAEARKMFNVMGLGIDPANVGDLLVRLTADGIEPVEIRQGHLTLNDPSKRMEELYVNGLLRHGGNPVLTWQAGQLAWLYDSNGNIRPYRARSRARIDGMVALIMAIRLAMTEKPAESTTVHTIDLGGGVMDFGRRSSWEDDDDDD